VPAKCWVFIAQSWAQTERHVELLKMKSVAAKSSIEFFFKLWLAFCAGCTVAGWGLSVAGGLNRAAYGGLAAAGLVFAVWYARQQNGMASLCRCRRWFANLWRKPPSCRRWLPRLWLLGALGALLGGILYPPNNYDALTYRFPRVLQWLAAGRWHWIHTPDERMNFSACGFEWLMTPLFAVARGDRLFFLLNLVPYLLMPALLFGVLRRLGVRPRVAWHWMWLLPGGYCFLLQAGSICNDAMATVFLLAAVYFATVAAETGKKPPLGWSLVAAGLLTNVKASNLPLLLPCAVAWWPARRSFLSPKILAVAALALMVSFAPQALLNQYHVGHWSGSVVVRVKTKIHDPVAGVLGNTLQLTVQNLAPPVNPWAKTVSRKLNNLLRSPGSHRLKQNFPRFSLDIAELPQEESAGLGLGITLLVGLGVVATAARARREKWQLKPFLWKRGWCVGLAGWAALLVFMTQMGSEATARLVAPYYPLLLLPVLLLPGQSWLARRRWWQVLVIGVVLLTLLILALTPSRPLWPAQTVWHWLGERHGNNRIIQRAATVYATYAGRADSLASLRKHFPATVRHIGLLSYGDEPDVSLWQPFGWRRVWHFCKDDPLTLLRDRQIEILVAQGSLFGTNAEIRLKEILSATGGNLLAREQIRLKASLNPKEWWVIALPASPGHVPGS
jgi:hypothetical protein